MRTAPTATLCSPPPRRWRRARTSRTASTTPCPTGTAAATPARSSSTSPASTTPRSPIPTAATTDENTPVLVNVLANDTDVDHGAVLTVTAASAPAGQGTRQRRRQPGPFDPGTDFDYLAEGETAVVTVSYTIAGRAWRDLVLDDRDHRHRQPMTPRSPMTTAPRPTRIARPGRRPRQRQRRRRRRDPDGHRGLGSGRPGHGHHRRQPGPVRPRIRFRLSRGRRERGGQVSYTFRTSMARPLGDDRDHGHRHQ